ncbi:MAG: hypothetical protein ACM3PF_07720 [Bacteroidota bacterium]
MLGSKQGFAGILLSTLVFAASASAQGTTAPAPAAKPAKAVTTAAKPATPAKMPSISATVKPVSATPAKADAAGAKAKGSAPMKAAATGPRSIVGEVIDPACWIINGVSGKGHAECAASCAKAGQTLAILEKKTNKVYILAASKPGEDPNKGVVDFVGQPVVVKGRVFARGGALGIQVTSIEAFNAKLAAETP